MLKLLLKNRFLFLMDKLTGQKKGKKVPTAAILALITAGFIALLVGVGYLLSWLLGPLFDGFSKAGLIWLYYAIAGTIALFGAFVFTFTYAQGAIYEADDNELLLSMPIRPSVILASRIWSLSWTVLPAWSPQEGRMFAAGQSSTMPCTRTSPSRPRSCRE